MERRARTLRPSGMREVALELPAVAWADVGGHAAIKQRLREAVQWPRTHPKLLKRLGAKAGSPASRSNHVLLKIRAASLPERLMY